MESGFCWRCEKRGVKNMSSFISGPGLIFFTSVLPTTLIFFLQVSFLLFLSLLSTPNFLFFFSIFLRPRRVRGDMMGSVAVRTGSLMFMEKAVYVHREHKTRQLCPESRWSATSALWAVVLCVCVLNPTHLCCSGMTDVFTTLFLGLKKVISKYSLWPNFKFLMSHYIYF